MERGFNQVRGGDPVAAKRAREKAWAGKLASAGTDMAKRHRTEWDMLTKRYRDRKADIEAQRKAAGYRVYPQIKEQLRPQGKQESDRRSRSFDTICRKAGVRQKADATPEEWAESRQRRENFQAASQDLPIRQSRGRRRTRIRKGK